MDSWHPAAASHAAATGFAPRRQRRHYRHQIQTLAYLNLDHSNGGIIRNVGDSGIAVQSVAPLVASQQVFLRFELSHPKVRVEGTGRVAWVDPMGQAGGHVWNISFPCDVLLCVLFPTGGYAGAGLWRFARGTSC